jgi:hypothetical protein
MSARVHISMSSAVMTVNGQVVARAQRFEYEGPAEGLGAALGLRQQLPLLEANTSEAPNGSRRGCYEGRVTKLGTIRACERCGRLVVHLRATGKPRPVHHRTCKPKRTP